jgi:hypothetical protein
MTGNGELNELVWSVVESSAAGDTVVGIYTTLSRAREVVSQLSNGRLEDYRIEGHSLDFGKETDIPWHVRLGKDGQHLSTAPFVGCSCSEDEVEFRRRSYIDADSEAMSIIVLAPTPRPAIEAAQRYRVWLLKQDAWAPSLRLEPIQAAQATVVATAANH